MKHFVTHGTYATERRPRSFLARAFPHILFYAEIVRIVVSGSRKAKQGRYDNADWCWSSRRALNALEAVGVHIEIEGVANFTSLKEPCVFLANHMSTLETFVLPVLIAPFRPVTFVVKKSLVEYPVFRHIMRSRDPITVGRENPREDLKAVLDGGTERLKAGTSIIIFPQTTRATLFDPSSFNSIGVKLARKAGVPVVPIAIRSDAWGNGRLLKDFGKIDPSKPVRFSFGKPIRIEGRGDEEHREVLGFIQGKLREWGVPTVTSASQT